MKLVDNFKLKKDEWYILYNKSNLSGIQYVIMIQPEEDVNNYGVYHATTAWSYYWDTNSTQKHTPTPQLYYYGDHDSSLFFELSDEEYLKHIVAEQI